MAPSTEPGPVEQWQQAAAAVLRKSGRLTGDDPDSSAWDALRRTTLDAVPIPPLGHPFMPEQVDSDGTPSRPRPLRFDAAWQARSHLLRPTPEQVLHELEHGATSLWLPAGQDLPALLADVLLDIAPVVLDHATLDDARRFGALIEARGVTPAPGTGFGLDPITTEMPADPAAIREQVVEAARLAHSAGVRAFTIDGTAVHDAGAGDAQELGYVIASLIGYLRILEDAGFSLLDAAGLIELRLAVTDEQFPSIAKIRAANQLWHGVLGECGVPALVMPQIHAVTSRPMMTRYDPYTNLLRTTVAAFAAGIGGADAVTVLPFDSALGIPADSARRWARNINALLLEESHLGVVSDPAGGAWAIEELTDGVADAAWQIVRTVERSGGILERAAYDELLRSVEDTARRRDELVATRRMPVTGVSEFPNLAEPLPDREPNPDWHVRSYAHAFEALRDAPPARPVFLATLGPIAAHTTRATFITNLFAAGGITVESAGATDGPGDLLAAYEGQAVVCLAGSDATYAEWGLQAIAALRDAGATYVLLAGRTELPVDAFFAAGQDALAFLDSVRPRLEDN